MTIWYRNQKAVPSSHSYYFITRFMSWGICSDVVHVFVRYRKWGKIAGTYCK